MNTNNHLSHLLAKWYPFKDNCEWVLATIYRTQGPCYRKSGAIMLFSSLGEQLGMLSGGCLESDIATNARKVMQTGKALTLCYDGSDEDDLSFHLGIGCGGTVHIMLQQINVENNYLSLVQVYQAFQQRISGYYYQYIITNETPEIASAPYFQAEAINSLSDTASIIEKNHHEKWLVNPVTPTPHLLIIGGGLDAQPLVSMAQQLGWQVSLWDPRPANARKAYFSNVNHILKGDAQVITAFALNKTVNAAILMSHNIKIDAQALQALSKIKLEYLGLLGPQHRREQVLKAAKLKPAELAFKFAGPSGLDIGGSLPESIALSILSECHACLFKKNAQSISQIL
ncbi:XdhC family protein [Colwellia sp. KU-HH00111]|uniref:XdhC family protein n=1 Tax=Colwellia sp. KU-HH00111 TaxID=3127652 RepID=UPI00336544DD